MRTTLIASLMLCIFAVTAMAEDNLLGIVQQIKDQTVHVTPAPDRPKVMPEELVTMQSRIPGIDEVVESGQGYIESSKTGTLVVTIIDGDPAIGDEVVLRKNEFLNDKSPNYDVYAWLKLSYADVRHRGFYNKETAKVGALCALGYMYEKGDGVKTDKLNAFIFFEYASEQFDNTPADCAAEYALRLLAGDQDNDPPKWDIRPEKSYEWFKYAAENGSYMGMLGYGSILGLMEKHNEAEDWFKKAIEIEPEESKGKAQNLRDDVRNMK